MSKAPSTAQEAHARVKSLMSERGVTFSGISQETGREITAFLRASACQGKVTPDRIRLRQIIAEYLGERVEDLWPAKYLTVPEETKPKGDRRNPTNETSKYISAKLRGLGLNFKMMSERYNLSQSSLRMAVAGEGQQDHLRFLVADILRIPEVELWPDIYKKEDVEPPKSTIFNAEERDAVIGLPAPSETMRRVLDRMPSSLGPTPRN